ncbi:MAG TPA: hypothetical protein VHQ86_04410 [Candidatus Saccharimonadia bacterium]|nr:hypothetical protein [Candidatus Saccharimonadia bacterium]
MRSLLAVLGAVIASSGAIPYIIDTIKGKTHPNIVTWVTYTLINCINAVAALQAGATSTALFSGIGVLALGCITITAIKHGVRKYTLFDITCQILAVAGIIVWRATGSPGAAVAIVLCVFMLASLPTWRHSWIAPQAETWEGFVIGAAGSILTLASLPSPSFVGLAYPTAVIINNLTIASIILSRRKTLAGRRTQSV